MLSFGGGNETSYARFQPLLSPTINMKTFTLPGKGRRLKEPQLRNIHLITDEHLEQIKGHIKSPYALYGHSMGTYVGHLLIHQLAKHNLPLPVHAFFTSKVAPSKNIDHKRSLLPNHEFIHRLKKLKGLPDAILESEEMLNIFLPIIKNDFYAIDTYKYKKEKPYPVDLSIMCGTEEAVPDEALLAWAEETSGAFHFKRFSGQHFWIFNHLTELCNYISETLAKYPTN
jgi:surfactin synthase thioesterase subunit